MALRSLLLRRVDGLLRRPERKHKRVRVKLEPKVDQHLRDVVRNQNGRLSKRRNPLESQLFDCRPVVFQRQVSLRKHELLAQRVGDLHDWTKPRLLDNNGSITGILCGISGILGTSSTSSASSSTSAYASASSSTSAYA